MQSNLPRGFRPKYTPSIGIFGHAFAEETGRYSAYYTYTGQSTEEETYVEYVTDPIECLATLPFWWLSMAQCTEESGTTTHTYQVDNYDVEEIRVTDKIKSHLGLTVVAEPLAANIGPLHMGLGLQFYFNNVFAKYDGTALATLPYFAMGAQF